MLIDIDKVNVAKAQLSNVIYTLINDFNNETGVKVDSIDIEYQGFFSNIKPMVEVISGVKIEVKNPC